LIFFKLYITRIYFKFSIEIEEKSGEYLLASPPSIIKCQDVHSRELGNNEDEA
jgi:hypothetical protein